MKHAGSEALDQINSLLEQIRNLPELKEKKRGIFYRKSQAFLHFHEDGDDLYADVKIGKQWSRYQVNTQKEWGAFIAHLRSISGL